jgi:hypothetical protein
VQHPGKTCSTTAFTFVYNVLLTRNTRHVFAAMLRSMLSFA